MIFLNASNDITVGRVIVANRIAELAILELLYARTVGILQPTSSAHLQKSAALLQKSKLP